MTLNDLNLNETRTIKSILFNGTMRRRLFDLGIVPNSEITSLYKSPFGSPKAYYVRGSVIAIRNTDAENILIK